MLANHATLAFLPCVSNNHWLTFVRIHAARFSTVPRSTSDEPQASGSSIHGAGPGFQGQVSKAEHLVRFEHPVFRRGFFESAPTVGAMMRRSDPAKCLRYRS
jgi:hypothetical protein